MKWGGGGGLELGWVGKRPGCGAERAFYAGCPESRPCLRDGLLEK